MPALEIHGTCDPRFKRVQEAFAAHFAQGEETGASVSAVIDGRSVIDLWAGHADPQRARPWQHDSIVNVFSTTKGITAIAALRLVERGLLDLDAPVARYWPEFAQADKATLPVRWLLSHRAGLPAVQEPLPPEALYSWSAMTGALAAQKPWWTPGAQHGYHALTYGWLVGEVIRRVTGVSVGEYVRREIAGPLGVDFEIGFGPGLDARVAELIPGAIDPSAPNLFAELLKNPESMAAKAFMNPPFVPDHANGRAWRAAELPAANGHTNARSLARIYGTLARGGTLDGVDLLRPETLARAWTEQSNGPDAILPLTTRLSLGFFLSTDDEKMGPSPRAFGHGGAGGSLSFADPDAKLGFGYAMNQMKNGIWLIDPRPKALYGALYESL